MRRLADLRRWLAISGVAAILFAVDIVADPQVSVIALYAALIVASVRNVGSRAVITMGAACGVLTILGHFLGPQPSGEVGLVNAVFDIVAIAATTFLTVRVDTANQATRQVQADLEHVSRLLLVDEMNTAIAHELNQPLGAAAANAHAALRWLTASPSNRSETLRALHRVIEAVEYAGTIVHQRRDLARKEPTSYLMVDIARIIEESCMFLEHRVRSHDIDLRVSMSEGLVVSGDRIRLQQVVINLLTNAIEAMSDVPWPRALTIEAMQEDGTVQVRLQDAGHGLDPAVAPRLFELFQTTKPAGLGMGLAISRSIVQAHGGVIEAMPNMPHGTVFTVCLPAASPDA